MFLSTGVIKLNIAYHHDHGINIRKSSTYKTYDFLCIGRIGIEKHNPRRRILEEKKKEEKKTS